MPQTFLRHKPRRLALMLNLQWPFMRHAEIFSGNQRYAEEWGWTSILDESARDTPPQAECFGTIGGIVARANQLLARLAAKAEFARTAPPAGRLPRFDGSGPSGSQAPFDPRLPHGRHPHLAEKHRQRSGSQGVRPTGAGHALRNHAAVVFGSA